LSYGPCVRIVYPAFAAYQPRLLAMSQMSYM